MSGHSKWSSIKHKKGAADAKRGKLFSKLARAIIVAAREGGPDPAGNLALQNAIEKARSYSMPKDNIERAIARGSGTGSETEAFEQITYEGYGPNGVAIIVEALTSVREALEQAGIESESAETTMVAKTTVELGDEAAARKTLRLIDALEDLDDVGEVYANFDIPEHLLEAVAG